MNKNIFRSVMVYNNDTQKDVAQALGVTEQTVSDKINGVSDFKQSEIKILIDRWNLDLKKVDEIFFAKEGENDGQAIRK